MYRYVAICVLHSLHIGVVLVHIVLKLEKMFINSFPLFFGFLISNNLVRITKITFYFLYYMHELLYSKTTPALNICRALK